MINYFKAIKILYDSLNKYIIKITSNKITLLNSSNDITFDKIFSNKNIPSFTNSAMDGYAIKYNKTLNINKKNKKKFIVIDEIKAGKYIKYKKLDDNYVVHIMTGAMIPSCFDSVIKVEDVIIKKKKYIIIDKTIKKNENVRLIGQDFKKNEMILDNCENINPHTAMILSTLGINDIIVIKKPNIFLLTTGCEIINNNEKITRKCLIYNSSAPYIISFFKTLLFKIKYLGITKDNIDEFLDKIRIVLSTNYFSIFMTTGAVSKGNFDFIPKILKKIGIKIFFHKTNIKPGKPILFAKYKKHIFFFCLPGNPISSIIGLRFFVYPFILFFMKQKIEKPLQAKLLNKSSLKVNKNTFLKGYAYSKKSCMYVKLLKHQESFKVRILSKCNCFVFLKKNTIIKKNALLDIYAYQPTI